METGRELVPVLNGYLGLELPENTGLEEMRERLAAHVNDLINHDFEKLVFLLYRIDVDEARMRALLQHREGEDSGQLIADLIIERQLQKIRSRKASQEKGNIPDEEKW